MKAITRASIIAFTPGFLLLVCIAGSAPARAELPSARLCLDPQFSTLQIGACMEKAADEADRRLNAAYKKAVSVIDQSDRTLQQKAEWKARLTAAQRAWIAFRDADCGDLIVSEWNSGSGTGAAIDACRYDRTVQRTDDLTSRYPLK